MRRGLLLGIVLIVLGLAAGAVWYFIKEGPRAPILVGLLHSKTGPWAGIEESMLEAELLAIEEINASGGLLGRPVRAVVADGRSDATTFARQAQRLIHGDKVSVLIGCWASEARKAVRPVVEEAHHLLIYPPAYEGLEVSPNIIYVGGPFNQQCVPAVSWCRDVRKAQKIYLIGNNSIWARTLSEIVKDQLHALQAELVGETFLGTDAEASRDGGAGLVNWDEAVARIEKAAPDVVISSVDARDNPALYSHLRRAGITPDRTPVISFSLDEEEVRRLPPADVVGQYASWSYFQSIDRDENREFVRKFKAKYGADRVVSDNIQIAYQSVVIWAQTVVEAETDEVEVINREILRQSHNAPAGIITIDADTRHGWRPFFLGRVRPDGQFEEVWSLPRSIRPVPYPASRTREEWDAFADGIMAQGLGRGPAPADGRVAQPARSVGSALSERPARGVVVLGDRENRP